MKKDLVSVVMSTYNESIDDLLVSIASILNQTYTKFEYLIVSDNPNNDMLNDFLQKIEDYDERIKVVYNEKNIGLPKSLNKAIALSSGDYILRMDADDISYPNRLEEELNCMKHNNADIVFTNYIYIDDKNNIIKRSGDSSFDKNNANNLLKKNIYHHPTALVKKHVIDEAGGYRDIKYAEDYDLWLRIYENDFKFYFLDKYLFLYKLREDGISLSNKPKQIASFLYVKELMIERLCNNGIDSHSPEKQNMFLREMLDDVDLKKVNQSFMKMSSTANMSLLNSLFIKLKIILTDEFYRNFYFKSRSLTQKLKKLKG